MEAMLEQTTEIPSLDTDNLPKLDKKRRHKKAQRFPEDMNGGSKLVLPAINPYKRKKSDNDDKPPRKMLPVNVLNFLFLHSCQIFSSQNKNEGIIIMK